MCGQAKSTEITELLIIICCLYFYDEVYLVVCKASKNSKEVYFLDVFRLQRSSLENG